MQKMQIRGAGAPSFHVVQVLTFLSVKENCTRAPCGVMGGEGNTRGSSKSKDYGGDVAAVACDTPGEHNFLLHGIPGEMIYRGRKRLYSIT